MRWWSIDDQDYIDTAQLTDEQVKAKLALLADREHRRERCPPALKGWVAIPPAITNKQRIEHLQAELVRRARDGDA
jgi:hypothetical protein